MYCATLRISGKDEYSCVEKALVFNSPHVKMVLKNINDYSINIMGLVLDDDHCA